jgi:hypothetical protein
MRKFILLALLTLGAGIVASQTRITPPCHSELVCTPDGKRCQRIQLCGDCRAQIICTPGGPGGADNCRVEYYGRDCH